MTILLVVGITVIVTFCIYVIGGVMITKCLDILSRRDEDEF